MIKNKLSREKSDWDAWRVRPTALMALEDPCGLP
jgi:hypothetical protein